MSAVLTPADEGELSTIVAEAAAAGTPLEITGGGTRLGLGRPVQADKTVSTQAISGITLYEPGALTLVAKAGTPMSEIDAALSAEGQMLAFEPIDHRALLGTGGEPTIGGAVAVAASGPRRIQRGACRDFMLGVKLVDGQGQQISNGGRVMKNVTGVDLVKLMAGSYGTLGVLTEIGFKVLPAPEATATLTVHGPDDHRAVQIMAEALGSPYDVASAAHLTPDQDGNKTLIRLEGLERSVAYRADALSKQLSKHAEVSIETDAANNAQTWARIRDAEFFAGTDRDVWRVSVKPSDGPHLRAALNGNGGSGEVFYDWGGGLVWLCVPDTLDPATLRAETARLGGHATLMRASVATRAAIDVFEPEVAPIAAISAGLRAKFDPSGILNPGRMRA